MDATRCSPRCQGRRDKTDEYRHHDKPQKYKGNNDSSNDYRSECFHHSLYSITSIYLEATGLKPETQARVPGSDKG
jgi:hypothetical protein